MAYLALRHWFIGLLTADADYQPRHTPFIAAIFSLRHISRWWLAACCHMNIHAAIATWLLPDADDYAIGTPLYAILPLRLRWLPIYLRLLRRYAIAADYAGFRHIGFDDFQ